MSNYNINNNIDSSALKYIIPRLNVQETVTDNFCVAASFPYDGTEGTNVGKMVYSYNGITWQNADSGGQLLQLVNKISYNGMVWLAGGITNDGVSMIYSVDGKNWLAVDSNIFSGQCTDIIWANGKWYACGGTYEYDLKRVNLKKEKLKTKTKFEDVKLKGFLPWSPVDEGRIAVSNDGLHWDTVYDDSWPNLFVSLAFDGKMLMAGGLDNALLYSLDGENWNDVNWDDGGMDIISSLAYNNNMWVAGGYDGQFAYSYNGLFWTRINDVTNFDEDCICNQIQWNGSVWVAIVYPIFSFSDYQIAYSHNGEDWTTLDVRNLIDICLSITWNGLFWIVGGANFGQDLFIPVFIYSLDGINWSLNERTILPYNRLRDNNNAIFAIQSRNIMNYYVACNPTYIPAMSLELDDYSITLNNNGQTYQIDATVYPSNATIQFLSYVSSNTNLATVDENGFVTAVNNGDVYGYVYIYVSTIDNFYSQTLTIQVIDYILARPAPAKDELELKNFVESTKLSLSKINPITKNVKNKKLTFKPAKAPASALAKYKRVPAPVVVEPVPAPAPAPCTCTGTCTCPAPAPAPESAPAPEPAPAPAPAPAAPAPAPAAPAPEPAAAPAPAPSA